MTDDELYPTDPPAGITITRVGRENRQALWELDLAGLSEPVATRWLLDAMTAAIAVDAHAVFSLDFANGVRVDLPWKHRRWLPVGSLTDQLRASAGVVDWLREWALSTTGDGSPVLDARGRPQRLSVNLHRGQLPPR